MKIGNWAQDLRPCKFLWPSWLKSTPQISNGKDILTFDEIIGFISKFWLKKVFFVKIGNTVQVSWLCKPFAQILFLGPRSLHEKKTRDEFIGYMIKFYMKLGLWARVLDLCHDLISLLHINCPKLVMSKTPNVLYSFGIKLLFHFKFNKILPERSSLFSKFRWVLGKGFIPRKMQKKKKNKIK